MPNDRSEQATTSDGILLSEWDNVKAVAADYANAVLSQDDIAMERARQRMLSLMNRMFRKYGERASILATKADYVVSNRRRAVLLLRAYTLARQAKDFKNVTLVASSLAEFYFDDEQDNDLGDVWLERLGDALKDYSDHSEMDVYRRLQREHQENGGRVQSSNEIRHD